MPEAPIADVMNAAADLLHVRGQVCVALRRGKHDEVAALLRAEEVAQDRLRQALADEYPAESVDEFAPAMQKLEMP